MTVDLALASTSKTSGLGLGLGLDHVVLEHIPGHRFAYAILLVGCSLATPGLRYIGPVCIRFTYHMQGDGIGRLLVYTRFHGGLSNPVFNQTGQLGDRWVEAAVDAVLIYAESVRYLLVLHRVWERVVIIGCLIHIHSIGHQGIYSLSYTM